MQLIAEEYKLLEIEALSGLAHENCKFWQREGGKAQAQDLFELRDKIEAVLGKIADIKYKLHIQP